MSCAVQASSRSSSTIREQAKSQSEWSLESNLSVVCSNQETEGSQWKRIRSNKKRTNGLTEEDGTIWEEALNTSASSNPHVALEHLVRDDRPSLPGSVLVQKSFEHISALDAFYGKDERKYRCIGEVLERHRGEDAGEVFVVGAKIDPKVVMDLSLVKIGGSNILEPSNRKLSEGRINENKPRLSIRILSRDSLFLIQYLERQVMYDDPSMKESRWQSRLLTLLCEDLHEMMQCYERHTLCR